MSGESTYYVYYKLPNGLSGIAEVIARNKDDAEKLAMRSVIKSRGAEVKKVVRM